MKISATYCAILFIVLIGGCKKNEGSPTELSSIDPQLFGDWYYSDSAKVSFPSPSIAYVGLRIGQNDTVRQLGIEFETGEMAPIEDISGSQILRANTGLLVLKHEMIPSGTWLDTLRYQVDRNILILSDTYTSTTYQRTQSGAAVTSPIHSTLTASIDSVIVQSLRVRSSLPAFVSVVNRTALTLQAYIPGGWIKISVDSFKGPGMYTIYPQKGQLDLTSQNSDVGIRFMSDSTSLGSISIEQYSEATQRCEGKFEFTAKALGFPILSRTLRNGSFSVLLYY